MDRLPRPGGRRAPRGFRTPLRRRVSRRAGWLLAGLVAASPASATTTQAPHAIAVPLPGDASDFGVSILPTDKISIVSGFTSGRDGDTPLLVAIDRDGHETWRRTVPANGDGALWAVCALGDRTFVGVGWAKSDAGDLDPLAVGFDAAGTVLWRRTYPAPTKDRLWSVARTDKGVIAAGESLNESSGRSEALVLRLGSDGNETGRASHGDQPVERVFSVQGLADGGYVLAGMSGDGPRESAGYDARIACYDTSDRLRWSRVWGGQGYDVAHDVHALPGGGYIVAGYGFAGATRGNDAFVLGLSPKGAVRWARRYGGAGDDRAVQVAPLADGGFALIGYSRSDTSGSDVVVRELDARGGLRWERSFGGRGQELGRAIAETNTGDLVAIGHSQSYGPRERMLYLRIDRAAGPHVTRSEP